MDGAPLIWVSPNRAIKTRHNGILGVALTISVVYLDIHMLQSLRVSLLFQHSEPPCVETFWEEILIIIIIKQRDLNRVDDTHARTHREYEPRRNPDASQIAWKSVVR